MNNIPQDAHSLEVFAIKEDERGNKWAYIGFKISNGNFEFITVPYTEPKNNNNIKRLVQLMLKSSDNNPYSGKLSREQNVHAAIELARLCKDFADKGQVDEAMNVSSEVWVEVIKELESLKN